nr:B3 domain-containing protein Os03g0212300-like [Aegilops tauschii subsp. strangulata]
MEGHVGDPPLEFVIRLYKPPHGRLHLSTPFARLMELEQPRALRLHMRGRGNGSIQVDVDFPAPHVVYFHQGWKTFARAHSLSEGHVLQFKLMEDGFLSVKVFGSPGARLGCSAESSTDDESSSSSNSDEEDSDGDDDGTDREGDDSDSG